MGTETLLDCVNWVQNDVLKRTDQQASLIRSVVNFYKTLCRKVPFDELMTTSAYYNCVVGQASYDLAALTPLLAPPLTGIQSIRLNFSSNSSVRLRRSSTRLYDALSFVQNGRPSTYARWGTSIELNPAPDSAAYQFRVRYWGQPVLATPPENTVLVMDDAWAELIKWELLYRAYYLIGKSDEAMALVAPGQQAAPGSPRRRVMSELGIIPRLWNDLLGTISSKENGDEDFSINPIVRDYSNRNG